MTNNIFDDDFDFDENPNTKSKQPKETAIKQNQQEDIFEDLMSDATEPPAAQNKPSTDKSEDVSSALLDELEWSEEHEPLPNEKKKKDAAQAALNMPVPELGNLLDEYGIDTEVKKTDVNDRMEKLRQRVESSSPTAKDVASKKSPIAMVLWLLGCVVLLGLALVQYAVFNVNTLVKVPEHREKLVTACALISCELPNADLKAIKLDHIKHRPSQVKSAANNVDIMAAIINNSDKAQLYPNLKVTIYGATGKVGEFVAQPKNYMKIEQTELFAGQARLVMFTVSIKNQNIKDIELKTFY